MYIEILMDIGICLSIYGVYIYSVIFSVYIIILNIVFLI